jgi:NAD(P)H-dependent flavin oxidoreductase YrpB (nitropropane dioxygenase family)
MIEIPGVEQPILLAPLGGGPSTPALAAAVANAGGLGAIAAAYLAPTEIVDIVSREAWPAVAPIRCRFRYRIC